MSEQIDDLIRAAWSCAQDEGCTAEQVLARWLIEAGRAVSPGYVRAPPRKTIPARAAVAPL